MLFLVVVYYLSSCMGPNVASNDVNDLNSRVQEFIAQGGIIPTNATTESVIDALNGKSNAPGFVPPPNSTNGTAIINLNLIEKVDFDSSKHIFTIKTRW